MKQKKYSKGMGWYNESDRHRLARLGIKTGRKINYAEIQSGLLDKDVDMRKSKVSLSNINVKDLSNDGAELFMDGYKYISLDTAFQNANNVPKLEKEFKSFTSLKSRESNSIFEDIQDFAKKKGWEEVTSGYTYNNENHLERDVQYYTFKDKEDEYYHLYLVHTGMDARVGFDFYGITTSDDYEIDEDVLVNFGDDAVDYTYDDINEQGKLYTEEYVAGSMFWDVMNKKGIYYKVINKEGTQGNFDKGIKVSYITENVYNRLPEQTKEGYESMR